MDQELKQYFEEAQTWDDSQNSLLAKSEKRAWRVAWGFGGLAALAIVALLFLMPLKQTISEVILLDKSAGTWEPVQRLKEVQVSLDEVFHRHFLTLFMLARENYTYEQAETNYYTAAAFMSPKLQSEWGELWDLKNPKSPLNVYKQTSSVKINIASINIKEKDDGTKDVATVRFSKSTDPNAFWVATITYKLVEAPKKESERRINPVGFQVVDYQVDPEVAGTRAVPAVQQAR